MLPEELKASLVANEAVLIGILALMLVIYGNARFHGKPSVLVDLDSRAAASTFWFYFASSLCLLLEYAGFISANAFKIDNQLLNLCLGLVGDLASVLLLASAWAYSRGKDLSVPATLFNLGFAVGFLVIWDFAFTFLAGSKNLLFVLLQQAPGLVLSAISTVTLGWVFFVRWGGAIGGIYFLIRVGYGILQIPGNIRVILGEDLKSAASLDPTFALLAAGKVLMAIAFLSLLCRSDIKGIAIDKPRYVPNGAIVLEEPEQRGLLREFIVALVMAIVAAVFADFTCSRTPWCVWR